MASAAKQIFICGAKRTPFGTFGGKLKGFTATDLGVHASKAVIAATGIDPKAIDTCVMGNVAHTSADAAYLSRHVALRSGMRQDSIALTVNRLCGSGFQSIISGAFEIQNGEAQVALVGGSESMSQAPLAVFGQDVRFGHRLGTDLKLQDLLWSALTDSYCNTPMGITAENLADIYKITRQETDEYSLRSQHGWAAAQKAGIFNAEIAPIEGLKGKKGPETFSVDEHARPETQMEGLAKLPPVFKKDGGRVTAGSASGICDGAASLLIASEDAVKTHKLTPLARIVGWSVAGVDPKIMGIGPAPAIRQLLKKTGKSLADIDRIEVNEAFAAQVIAVEKDLGIDR
jgi:acetyl-CoA acyltransferase 2